MAELLARQGQLARAVAVYRAIVRERPEDAELRDRLAELEATLDGERNARGDRMSFREHIQRVVDGVPGTVACSLMGFDGIAIDSYEVGGADLDVQSMLTEYSSIAGQVRRALEGAPQLGAFTELTIDTGKHVALVRMVNTEYFLAALLKPEALAPKARYLMRVAAPKIQKELS